MGILDRLARAERRIQKKLDQLFGTGAARTPLEIRRQILDEVESRIIVDRGKKLFPFEGIEVRLLPETEPMKQVFTSAFIEDRSLEDDIRGIVQTASRAPGKPNIQIAIDPAGLSDRPAGGKMFRVDFQTSEKSGALPQKLPDALLTVLTGTAEQAEYPVAKERFYIGRLKDLLDRDGRLVRKNDLVFLDNGDEINSTVGRAHAVLWFNREKGEFRVVDEMSRYGTHIFRGNRNIEVPSGNVRGVGLRPDDEIYFGRACVKFTQR